MPPRRRAGPAAAAAAAAILAPQQPSTVANVSDEPDLYNNGCPVMRDESSVIVRLNDEFHVLSLSEYIPLCSQAIKTTINGMDQVTIGGDFVRLEQIAQQKTLQEKIENVWLTEVFQHRRKLYLVKLSGDSKLLSSFRTKVDLIKDANNETKFYPKLLQKIQMENAAAKLSLRTDSAEVPQPPRSNSVIDRVSQQTTVVHTLDQQNTQCELHNQIVIATQGAFVLVDKSSGHPCVMKQGDAEGMFKLLGTHDTEFTPEMHQTVLSRLVTTKEEWKKEVIYMERVDDLRGDTFWLIEHENCNHQLRVNHNVVKNLRDYFLCESIEDLKPEQDATKDSGAPALNLFDPSGSAIVPSIESSSQSLLDNDTLIGKRGTKFTVHAKHIPAVGPNKVTNKTHCMVSDEYGQWDAMMYAVINKRKEANPSAWSDDDKGAGFNPKVDIDAITAVKEEYGTFGEGDLIVKGAVGLTRGKSATITVIFDIKNSDKKTWASKVRMNKQYLGNELFRLSRSKFLTIANGSNEDVIEAAKRVPGSVAANWAENQTRTVSLSPGHDITAAAVETKVDKVIAMLEQMLYEVRKLLRDAH